MKTTKTTKTTVLLILVLTLTLALISAPTPQELEDYLSGSQQEIKEKVEEFTELSGGDRNAIWEKSGEEYSIEKDVMMKEYLKLINEKKNQALRSGNLASFFGGTLANVLIREGKKNDIGGLRITLASEELKGSQIDIDIDFEKFKKDLDGNLKKLGIDPQGSLLEGDIKIRGFGNPKLKWSEEQGKENVIGDGKVWVDMSNLPVGTSKIEYDGSKFTLTLRGGGKVVLEPGATNKDGGLALEGFDVDNLRDIVFTAGTNGEISINAEGIKLKGDAEVHYNGLVLTKNPKEAEGFVRATKDGFYLKGVKAKVINPAGEGFIGMIAGKNEKLLRIANGQALTLRDLVSMKDGILANANSPVVEVIHFDDAEKKVSRDRVFAGSVSTAPSFRQLITTRESLGDIYFSFNEQTGEVVAVKKEGAWVRIGDSMTEDLQKIYTASSDTVQQIITDSLNPETTVDYTYIRSARNKDFWLRRGKTVHVDAKVLDGVSMSIDDGKITHVRKIGVNNGAWLKFSETSDMSEIYGTSTQRVGDYLRTSKDETINPDLEKYIANTVPPNTPDFMIIAGDNVLMVGYVEVNIQQDLGSLNFYNLDDDAKVNVNGLKLSANEQGKLEYQRAPVKTNEFNVDYVSITNQRSDGSWITSSDTYEILDQRGDAGNTPIIDSDRFVAGREVFTGPLGVTIDAYVSMSQESVERTGANKIQEGGDIRDILENEGYEVRLDTKLPVSGVSVTVRDSDKLLDEVILPRLDDWILGLGGNLFEGEGELAEWLIGDRQIKLQTSQNINNLVRSSVVGKYNGGELGIGFRHVPNKNPQIIVYENGKIINTVNLQGQNAKLVKDILWGVRIVPYVNNDVRKIWGQNIGNKVNINNGLGRWETWKWGGVANLGNTKLNKYSELVK